MDPFLKFRRIQRRLRGLLLTWWIRAFGGTVGKGLQAERGVHLRWRPHPGLVLGENVYLGIGVVIDAPPGSLLTLEKRVKVMHYTVIAVSQYLSIGAYSQIAEHCSIRDSDHGMELDRPMSEQSISSPTTIGGDVWIARGCCVLRGAFVGDGAVIGANSVVKGTIPPLFIAAGAPARLIKSREKVA